jgi:hypothetical protein
MADSKKPEAKPHIKKLKAKYIRDEGYSVQYANGIIGGPTLKGEIVLNFFIELSEIPNLSVYKVDENGKVGSEEMNERTPKSLDNGAITLTRKLVSGIIINIQEAELIQNWLSNQIEIAKVNLAKIKEASQNI